MDRDILVLTQCEIEETSIQREEKEKMVNYPLVSIIVLNYNGQEFLKDCLGSVLSSEYPNFEVLFVDNNSTDGSVELVRELFGNDPHLRIIRNEANLGFCEGNNVGVRASKGKYVIFLNNDTIVDPHWVKELVNAIDKDLSIGAAQCKILRKGDRDVIDSAGGTFDKFGFAVRKGHGQLDRGQFDKVEEIPHAIAVAMVVRKDVLDEVGLFDPNFFIHLDNVDLCLRIHLNGHKIVFVPKSRVWHVGRGGIGAPGIYHTCKNRITIPLKNFEPLNSLKYTLIYGIFILGMALLFLLTRKLKLGIAAIRGLVWNIVNFKYIWSNRQWIQRKVRKMPDREILKTFGSAPTSIFRLIGAK